MPRMRDAIRSGWKYSSWSSFSPTDASLIGLPVTALTERAAPPRASPSSFVMSTPSKAIRSWKASATATASWPVIASRTSRTFIGFASLRTATSSSINSSSTCRRPAVSTMATSSASSRARSIPRRVDDLHDLLAGREALGHVRADRALAHRRDKVLDDLEVDVRLEQGEPDLPHRARDRLVVEAPAAAKVAERGLQLVGERVEHRRASVPAALLGVSPSSSRRKERRWQTSRRS